MNLSPEVTTWPELEAAYRAKSAQTSSELPFGPVKQVETRSFAQHSALDPLIARWDPLVSELLSHMARLTTWTCSASPDRLPPDFSVEPVTLNKDRTPEPSLVWQVGGRIAGMHESGAAFGVQVEYFRVTLEVSSALEPLAFIVESQTLQLRTEPGVAALKAVLVEAYRDGPKSESGFIW